MSVHSQDAKNPFEENEGENPRREGNAEEDAPPPTHPPRSGYAFDDDDDDGGGGGENAVDSDLGIHAHEGDGDRGGGTDGFEQEAEQAAVQAAGEGEEEGQHDEEQPHEEADEAEEEEEESIRSIGLRLSELEATDRTGSGRYSLELRMAVAEAETLRQFIKTQQDILDAATERSTHQEGNEPAWGKAPPPVLLPLTTQNVKARLHAEPRVAMAAQRIAHAARQLRVLQARVTKLRTLLHSELPRSVRREEQEASLVAFAKAELFGVSHAPPSGAVADTVSVQQMLETASAKDELPSHVNEEMAESVALMKKFLQALPYVGDTAKSHAVKRLLMELGHLSQHTLRLHRYKAHLEGKLRTAGRLEESSLLTAEEWGLMASQMAYAEDIAQLGSARSLREADTVRRNAALWQRLTALQSALASLVVANTLSSPDAPTGTSAHKTASASLFREKAAVEEETARLKALRDALLREVLFLRKQARDGSHGCKAVTGVRYDLLLDAGQATQPSESEEVSVTGPSMVRQLVADSHARLATAVRTFLAPSITGDESDDDAADDSGKASSTASLRARVMKLEGQITARQQSMAALMAANARLAQEIQSAPHASEISSEPEKAAQLANMLLMKLGFTRRKDEAAAAGEREGPGEDDSPEEEEEQQDTSLVAIESSVLSQYRQRAEELLSAANTHLAEMNERWLMPEQRSRGRAALLLRLLTLNDLAELAKTSPAALSPTTTTTTTTAAAAGAVTALEHELLPSCEDDSGDSAPPLLPSHIPLLPADNNDAQEAFRTMLEERLRNAQPAWMATRQACQAAREELDWYGQFVVEEIPERLARAQEEKKALLQRTLDAGKRSKQASDDKRLVATLTEEIKELEESHLAPAQGRVAHLKSQLHRLKEEYALAKDAAEAERQLRKQQEEEEQRAERERQEQQQQQQQQLGQVHEEAAPCAEEEQEETRGRTPPTEAVALDGDGIEHPHEEAAQHAADDTDIAADTYSEAEASSPFAEDNADEEEEQQQAREEGMEESYGDAYPVISEEREVSSPLMGDEEGSKNAAPPGTALDEPAARQESDGAGEEAGEWDPVAPQEADHQPEQHQEEAAQQPPPAVLRAVTEDPFFSGFGFDEEEDS